MNKERLILENINNYDQSQLKPCNSCNLHPVNCDKQYVAESPGKSTSVMCMRFGAVEIIDMSQLDEVRKVSIKRKNGDPQANREVSEGSAAAL